MQQEIHKKLGFGLMRLPRKNQEFDQPQIEKMVDAFIDAGGNYFDTARIYPGSEEITREVLVKRYPREKFLLASKLAAWNKCQSREDAIAQFETSLRLTQAEYFDCYLLHNLGEKRTAVFDNFGLWDFVQEKKAAGLIRHAGFSFHSTAEDLEDILQKHPEMEFVQLQINYADWDDPKIQSRRCYEVARKYNKPVIVMEPVKGGLLANPPEPVRNILKDAAPALSPAAWAIRFAASLDGVVTVLSGMSNMEQMKDNLASMSGFKPLTDKDLAVIQQASETLKSLQLIPCTNCQYCQKVCPENIGIAGTLDAMNMLYAYNNPEFAANKEHWGVTVPGKNLADHCIQCGECEKVCPQHIPIRKFLAESNAKLPRNKK